MTILEEKLACTPISTSSKTATVEMTIPRADFMVAIKEQI